MVLFVFLFQATAGEDAASRFYHHGAGPLAVIFSSAGARGRGFRLS